MQNPLPTQGNYVYALLCEQSKGSDGFVKIGITKNLRNRFSSIQTGCPVPVKLCCFIGVPDRDVSARLESLLHESFSDRRVSGEWFKFDFLSKQDKECFNAVCRKCFSAILGEGRSWSTVTPEEIKRYGDYAKTHKSGYTKSVEPQAVREIRELYARKALEESKSVNKILNNPHSLENSGFWRG